MSEARRGFSDIEITGAAPELALNRLTRRNIPFKNLVKQDDFCLRCRIRSADLNAAETAVTTALCTLQVLGQGGILRRAEALRERPVLVIGVLLSFLCMLFAQNFVWFIRIEGAETVSTDSLLAALEEEGVRFGAWGPALDSQYLKNRMLNRIQALRWLTVNREGMVATVLVAEREAADPHIDMSRITDIVADRDGVITEVSVYNGLSLVTPGDAVREGQVLVTGIQEWTTHTTATRALAEVRAYTLRTLQGAAPAERCEKHYTGRTETVRTLILQRNRIKISGNSSIFGMSCDKMIKTVSLVFPGGFALPVSLETAVLREYDTSVVSVSREEAELQLTKAGRSLVRSDMIAGTIGETHVAMTRTEELYTAELAFFCEEVISRTVPVSLFGEEVEYGEIDQRGEN